MRIYECVIKNVDGVVSCMRIMNTDEADIFAVKSLWFGHEVRIFCCHQKVRNW